MKYFEITLTIMLKENILFTKSGGKIGQVLHRLMLNDSVLTVLHSEKNVKNLVFSNLYPTEKDGFYKAGNVYILRIRCFDSSVANALKKVTREDKGNHLFTVLASEIKTVRQFHIASFTSVTPVIITYKKGDYDRCWTIQDDLMALQGQLQNNLIKKYERLTSEEININHNFIQLFEILNKKPIKVVYENKDKQGRTFLGNKFKIYPNDDDLSQKLAFTALACGLGEKNALLGAGFCLSEKLK